MNGLLAWLAMSTAASYSLHPGSLAAVAKQPNVVIFMADDLGIGDVGCFGNDTMRTPNIDRIADEGVKLTQHLAASAVCTPSRAAFLTGRYPSRMGLAGANFMRAIPFLTGSAGLPGNETTFASVAKKHGYSTALIGKWHLGVYCEGTDEASFCHHPLQHGFDYFYGLPLTNARDFGPKSWNSVTRHLSNFDRILYAVALGGCLLCAALWNFSLMPKWCAMLLLLFILVPAFTVKFVLVNIALLNSVVMRNYDYVEQPIHFENFTQRLVTEGVEFLERTQTINGRPFLLMMSWIQVHTFLHTSQEFRRRSRHGAYGDNVEELDWSVGEVLRCLERLKLLDDTFVYFTSDNGGYLEARGDLGIQEGGWNGIYRGGKAHEVMEGGIRVPTVAMWRGHIPPGTVVNVPTSLMDIFTTLTTTVWNDPLPTDRVVDGRNLYPLMTGKNRTPPHRFMMHYCGDQIHAVRFTPGNGDDVFKVYYATPNWLPGTQECQKTCYCTEGFVTWHDPPVLYNVGRDPAEQWPLRATDHPGVLDEIRRAVTEHLSTVDRVDHQLTVGRMFPRLWRQPCCNFPSCECVDPTYEQIVRQLQAKGPDKRNTD